MRILKTDGPPGRNASAPPVPSPLVNNGVNTQPNLPEPGSQPSTGRPTFQKQRSISELLSFTEPGPPPKPITPVEDKPMYNPYAPQGGSQIQQPMTMVFSGQAARVLPPVTKVPVVP